MRDTNRGDSSKAIVVQLIAMLTVVLLLSGTFMAVLANTAAAVPGTNTASQVPAGVVYSLPFTLTNTQPVATPSPFQEMIEVDSAAYSSYESPNLQNVEFFYSNATIIPSWLESGNNYSATGTIYWLYLTLGIQADSSVTIYIGFTSTVTNLFNDKVTGEAPELSSIYGEYDNGGNIFTAYWNFSGSALPYDWSSQIGAGASVTVDNGITYQSPGYANGGTIVASAESYDLSNHIADGLIQSSYVGNALGPYYFVNATAANGNYAVWTAPWTFASLSPTTPLNSNWNVVSSWANTTNKEVVLNYNEASLSYALSDPRRRSYLSKPQEWTFRPPTCNGRG